MVLSHWSVCSADVSRVVEFVVFQPLSNPFASTLSALEKNYSRRLWACLRDVCLFGGGAVGLNLHAVVAGV